MILVTCSPDQLVPEASWNAELEEDLFWAAAFAIIASYAQMFQCLRCFGERVMSFFVMPVDECPMTLQQTWKWEIRILGDYMA